MHGYASDKTPTQGCAHRGQVRGIAVVDEDTYCIDVLTQIAAVTKALQP